jgi:hypothetical protein
MCQHWSHACYLIRILAWRALGYDEDGMELYFTDPRTAEHVKQRKDQDVNEFVNAMKRAKPTPRMVQNPSGIVNALSDILRPLLQTQQFRPKTVLILTDGKWEGLSSDTAVDELIRRSLAQLPGSANTISSRPITFQFISFGYDKAALERLRRLDDDIQHPNYPFVALLRSCRTPIADLSLVTSSIPSTPREMSIRCSSAVCRKLWIKLSTTVRVALHTSPSYRSRIALCPHWHCQRRYEAETPYDDSVLSFSLNVRHNRDRGYGTFI